MPEPVRYVGDASTAIKWHLEDEEHTLEATELLADFYRGRVSILAPDNIRHVIADLRLLHTLRGRFPWTMWIGDYRSPTA